MYFDPNIKVSPPQQRRKFPRLDIQCRARIRIGNRHYAGYIHNISRGGAKLRTITPIRRLGNVILRLPDLPPLQSALRWTDSYNAGVAFDMPLTKAELVKWAQTRSASLDFEQLVEAEITEQVFADLEF